ncbi:VOC family protein [Niveispirillum fermenti]|uniref:VOC family protein n=1 Tax=Niveispirillum fermenti TaxID=1233113 RepID=UPI003A88ADDF
MPRQISTFLMFQGKAEEAMRFYTSLFADGEITALFRYGPDQGGVEGTVMQAAFRMAGQNFVCIDSSIDHGFGFTPAITLFIDCTDDAELERLYQALSVDGQVLMPLGEYPFAQRYVWLVDRFGLSWQLALKRVG